MATMHLKAKGSSTVDNLVTLEYVGLETVRSAAKHVKFIPPVLNQYHRSTSLERFFCVVLGSLQLKY